MINAAYFLIIDVESIGIHGEHFAVAGEIYDAAGARVDGTDFCFACPPSTAKGRELDHEWVRRHVPTIPGTCESPDDVCLAFWLKWEEFKGRFPRIVMAAECAWPVESSFLSACIAQDEGARVWGGPYPLHDIASVMLAAGMDPMKEYDRRPDEIPKHHPLADVRQSARLLSTAFSVVKGISR